MLGPPCGSCICQMLNISKLPGSKGQPAEQLRVAAVPATLPNAGDLATWLHASAWSFGEELRPVPLTSHVMSYPSNSCDYLYEQHLGSKVSSVIQQHSTGKLTLVFVSSRKGTQGLAGKLSQQLHHHSGAETPTCRCAPGSKTRRWRA
jgi:replicative superfamily II helicase